MRMWGLGGSKSHKQTDGCGTLACSHSKGERRESANSRAKRAKVSTGARWANRRFALSLMSGGGHRVRTGIELVSMQIL